jgi:hypothetical protein
MNGIGYNNTRTSGLTGISIMTTRLVNVSRSTHPQQNNLHQTNNVVKPITIREADYYEQKYKELVLHNMKAKAKQLRYEIALKPLAGSEVSQERWPSTDMSVR